jgi:hypothetical protein
MYTITCLDFVLQAHLKATPAETQLPKLLKELAKRKSYIP